MQGISLQRHLHFWTIDYKSAIDSQRIGDRKTCPRAESRLISILNSNIHFHLEKLLSSVNWFSVIQLRKHKNDSAVFLGKTNNKYKNNVFLGDKYNSPTKSSVSQS